MRESPYRQWLDCVGGPLCGRRLFVPRGPFCIHVYEDGQWLWGSPGTGPAVVRDAALVGVYTRRLGAGGREQLWWANGGTTRPPMTARPHDPAPSIPAADPSPFRDLTTDCPSPPDATIDGALQRDADTFCEHEAEELLRHIAHLVRQRGPAWLEGMRRRFAESLAAAFYWSPRVTSAANEVWDAVVPEEDQDDDLPW